MHAYVGLGANLGDREGTLAAAVRALDAVPGVRVVGVSRLYATRPVGPAGQPEYRNAAVALELRPAGSAAGPGPGGAPSPAAAAAALLRSLKDLEQRFGRRLRARWAPRELDLDLLIFGRHVLSLADPPLTVPHPLARERLFVLAPLRDVAPRLVPPGWGETVETAYRRQLRLEGEDAARAIGEWDAAAGRWKSLSSRKGSIPAPA